MRASERLEQRNDILEVIAQIDDDLKGLSDDKSFRSAQQAREMLETRHELSRELQSLGFQAPELDERLRNREGTLSSRRPRFGGGDDPSRTGVVAKRRIGPASAS
ncbi:hypothetical protein PBI_MINIMAC_48 [Mycobacterium phage MiniMac]|nr:hypothetical protein PBI_MINIMAC_48 [Mycobacterium phage MiniMac]